MKTKKKFFFIKNKNRKSKKKSKINKLNNIFNKKKNKILLVKETKKNKNKKYVKTIKQKFKESPGNFLPLEDLFRDKNQNNMNINVNPYISKQLLLHNKKYKKRLDYIENVMNKKYKEIRRENKQTIRKLFKEILSRSYDSTKEYFDSFYDYQIYYVIEKKSNYPKLVFETNCGKQFTFIDFNKISENFTFFNIGNIKISDNYLIFAVDIYGNNLYHIFLKPLYKNEIKDLSLRYKRKIYIKTHELFNSKNDGYKLISSNSSGNFILNDNKIYFINVSNDFSQKYIYCYDLYEKTLNKIYTRKDEGSFINLFLLNNNIFLNLSRYDGNSLHILNDKQFVNLIPFKKDYTYDIDKFNGTYYLLEHYKYKNAIYKTHNFNTKELLHKSNNKLDIFENLLVLNDKYILCMCRRLNESFLVIINTCKNNETKYLKLLTDKALYHDSSDNYISKLKMYYYNYILTPHSKQSNDFYIQIQSFLLPKQTLYINLDKEEMHILDNSKIASNMMVHQYYNKNYEINKVFMNYDGSKYEDKFIFLPGKTNVGFYLMYKKGLDLKNNNKCFISGYGAYGNHTETEFESHVGGAQFYGSLMDRDFIIVLTYIRGDDFGGYGFYKDGRLKNRKNTYNDFIKIAEYLIKHNYTKPERLAIYGRSAGGLLIGNVINMKPELFKLAIMGVPFVMPHKVMKNKNNPLSFESHFEFGNPFVKEEENYIKKYSPFLQIKKELNYPNIFIFSNLYDSQTPYNESFSYYNKIKECDVFKNNKKDLIYYLNDKYGHKQSSKKIEQYYDYSCYFSIILKYIK